MNLKTKIFTKLHSLFRITEPASWARISAADVLAVPDVGKVALNKLRLHLARHGVSLKGDNPPAYWIETLSRPADESSPVGACPFTIVIDSNETFPFPFDSIHDREGALVSVPTVRRPLYLSGLADYTIDGMESLIQIERKAEDLFSSFSERRENFEDEISRLSSMCEFAAVVVEMPWRDILGDEHVHGARAKSISRTVQSWMINYPGVHWIMCEGRFHAEQITFRLLEKFYWMKMRERSSETMRDLHQGLWDEV